MNGSHSGVARLIEAFLRGNLSILLMLVALAAGAIALLATPREEEPQIVVPLADIFVQYPGGSAEEVERLVASRLERMLYQIDGVEYVYSMSMPGQAIITVRFFVGEDREESLIKLYNKVFQNVDKVTPGITGWVIKPVEVDDVPVVNVTLTSRRYDTFELYRIAEEVVARLQHIENTAAITIHGGEKRVVTVQLDANRLAAYGMSPGEVAAAIQASNAQLESGSFDQAGVSVKVSAGPFLKDAREVADLLVGLHDGRPVYLRDVAEVLDGPAELKTYSRFGFGPAASAGQSAAEPQPAVTIAVAKKKGSNAVHVTREVRAMIESLRGVIIPHEVEAVVTRDYGQTANEKVNSLVTSLGEAVITVIVLIALIMNWRVGLIVALAVPITYSLTLLVNYLAGYTINRVTLFALILALGLLVDDPIVAVENIYRHLKLGKQRRDEAILTAMNEVMPPLILATLAVMVAFVPMFFITGMMGPYMRPMALNVPLAMLSSMIVSLMITPWVSKVMLKGADFASHDETSGDVTRSPVYRVYSRLVRPFIESRRKARRMLTVVALLFVGSVALALGVVPLKMLPFDNKNELQLVVDMPEGTPLETTDAVVRDLEAFLRTVPEVQNFTSISGGASPMDFNGLVRHYYLRQGPHVADIRINLAHRKQRKMNSHAIALRIRPDVERIAAKWGASVKIVEVPPGPPVLATIVAEIYGRPHHRYAELIAAAEIVKKRMREERGVVDVDDYVEADQPKVVYRLDRDKAARNGVSVEAAARTLRIALGGYDAGVLHAPGEQNETPIRLQLPRALRSDVERLKTIPVKGQGGNLVQLGEIGSFETTVEDKTIFHKNLERVVYVTADTAGRGPAYPVLALKSWFKKHPLPDGIRVEWAGEGEWKITVDVFRDLGLAFAAALLGIYVLLVYETRSYALPGVIMLSIPLTMIGIMPGFWLLNVLVNRPVAGYPDPVFFTATAMIGMIALAGIVVRNGIILIDFIRLQVERGRPIADAILESGAVRLRPIVLTAGTTLLGAWPITLDPIFSGLAWSLIFGLFVSTLFTLVVIPVVYYLIYGNRPAEVAA
ncbi:MAG: efflux RND transporter permease subunit [Kiritimatiellae bacterium]|nr:efflux RND transporter permease subunit [Kiritimatiellia bacterium]MDW8458846.1 efflux RND transporter permease subunit [Verrucomicrobiota bacterium]